VISCGTVLALAKVIAGVAGIYNRATYAAEKRAALNLWANHVAVLVSQANGANITKLRG